jgi:hypothetical protein
MLVNAHKIIPCNNPTEVIILISGFPVLAVSLANQKETDEVITNKMIVRICIFANGISGWN